MRRPRTNARIGALCLLAVGCSRALAPVDTTSGLGTASPEAADPVAAARTMEAAAREFARRPVLEAVRAAESLWLRAAMLDATDAVPVIGAVRAQTWLAEHEPVVTTRQAKATDSVTTAQWCGRRDPANPACPYWLAVAVGVQANQRRSTAADGLEVIVRALHRAIAADESTDHAGPHRVLALVLVRAPGWPAGPGDPDTGLVHAQRAVQLAGDHPANLLALAEAYAATEQQAASRAQYACARDAGRAAEASGHPDAREWIDEAERALGSAVAVCER